MLSTERLLDELVRHTDALADAVRDADPTAPVPACPGWGARDLAEHVGGVHRWAATHVAERREKLARRGETDPPMPEETDAQAAWLRAGAEQVADAVRSVGDDVVVGGFGSSVPVRFWARRQCHETLVHRGDAEVAAGRAPWVGVAADVAADGIDEWLAIVELGGRRRTALHGTGETLHVHATDDDLDGAGEWVITREEAGLRVEQAHRKADVAVRGPAMTLLGVLTGRVPPEHADVRGDADLLAHWLAHATV